MLSPDSSCQQDVLWHDGNLPGMDGTQVGVIKQPDKVCLHCFLETQYHRRLEPQFCVLAISLTNLWKGSFRMSSAEVFWKWRMSCRATVPALYLWGFTCLPCILPSCIFLFCSGVQSNTPWPSKVLSLGREIKGLVAFCRLGDKLCSLYVVPYGPPSVLVVRPHPLSSYAC